MMIGLVRLLSGAGIVEGEQLESAERASTCPRSLRSVAPRAKLFAALILSVAPAAAQAAPITYLVTDGSVALTVFTGTTAIGSSSSPTLSGTVTIDMANQSLDAVNILLAPNIGLSLTEPYGGYDEITIESASLTDAAGYSSTLTASDPGSFTVLGGPLGVSGTWGGTDSSSTNPPVGGIPIAYNVSSITAVVNSAPSIEINGVTLNALSGAGFGEAEDLTVLANIVVTGLIPIPEPSTGLLFSLGLGLLAARQRRD
ncbi:MAG: PEP-CTERM sorting domain-containing protein [bacterium]|nr:PEP-CTERM sorting domain-containing protein [bacterium]